MCHRSKALFLQKQVKFLNNTTKSEKNIATLMGLSVLMNGDPLLLFHIFKVNYLFTNFVPNIMKFYLSAFAESKPLETLAKRRDWE